MMKVIGNKTGEFRVSEDTPVAASVLAGPFETSADAWGWIDRHEFPLSRRQRPKRIVLDRVQVRKLAPVILKTAKLNRYDKRFVSDFLKQANRAITDMLVTEAEAGQWNRIKGKST